MLTDCNNVHSVHLKTHTFKMMLFSMNLSCVSNLFCEVYIYTHPTIIDVKIDWFKVNRFTLHLSKQKHV